MSFSFSSCSESDPNSPTNETTEVNLEKVTQQYVNDVVFVTYSKLADQSEQLFNKLEALRVKLNAGQTVNQSEIDALCDNYKEQERYGKQAKRSSMVLQKRRISTHKSLMLCPCSTRHCWPFTLVLS